MRNAYKILDESPKGNEHSEDLVLDGRLILKWIIGIQGRWGGLDLPGSWQGMVTVYYEHDNTFSGSIKGGKCIY
jgi:hypothetical protein